MVERAGERQPLWFAQAWELLRERLDAIEQRQEAQGDKLSEIHQETRRTNGRVSHTEKQLDKHLDEHSKRSSENRQHIHGFILAIVGAFIGVAGGGVVVTALSGGFH